MPIDESIKTAKDGISLIGDIIKVAGDNPDIKQAGSNLGKAALTITATINNALLPLAAVNFAFEKARTYFSKKFQEDLLNKTSAIPLEHLVEPKASIAGPTLQGLAFAHEEISLKDMYLSLLATTMDGRIAVEAHPAFVEIIKQLNSEEARLIREVLQSHIPNAICEIILTTEGQAGWKVMATHILPYMDSDTNLPIDSPRVPAMVDNLIRLGLVQVTYERYLIESERYTWVDQRPEVIKLRQQFNNETQKITFRKGIISRTALGIQFAKAVGLETNNMFQPG